MAIMPGSIMPIRDNMQAFGREIRISKKTAQDFLIRAGILNKQGELAKPYRN